MARKDANGLTDQQRKFCDLYLANGLNASKAYQEAYPKCKTEASARASASQLLTNPNVSEYLAVQAQKVTEKAEVSAEWVIANFKKIAERCMQAEPVMEFDPDSKEMVESGEYKFDSTGANTALTRIGQYLQMFTEKREVKHSGTVAYQQNLTGE